MLPRKRVFPNLFRVIERVGIVFLVIPNNLVVTAYRQYLDMILINGLDRFKPRIEAIFKELRFLTASGAGHVVHIYDVARPDKDVRLFLHYSSADIRNCASIDAVLIFRSG